MNMRRTWGFRFSFSDGIALLVFVVVGCGFAHAGSPFGWLLFLAAGHFFLFCNVFRIIRHLELIWAALFISNVMLWSVFDRLSWSTVFLTQLPVTVSLIGFEMCQSRYHGIFARQINPSLNRYLDTDIF